MASNIHNVEKVLIGGAEIGKLNGLDYTAPTPSSPAKLTARFFNPSNDFREPTLQINSSTRISIGRIDLKMYPVSYEVSHDGEGASSISVEFVDGSFILDQLHVGLNTKYFNTSSGLGPKLSHSNIILVGSEVDPCLNNNKDEFIQDPCSTCGEDEDQNPILDIDCASLRRNNILDIDYSFSELINAIRSKGLNVSFSNGSQFDDNYRSSYTGSLRSVLQSWCSDFGLSFYFDDNLLGSGIIKIFDLTQGIKIDVGSLRNSDQVKSFSESKSIEHRRSGGLVSHFAKEGHFKTYNCSAAYHGTITCRPILLKDLVSNAEWTPAKGSFNAYSTNLKNELNVIEIASTLSSYNKAFRDAFVWFDAYGIRDADSARSNGVDTDFAPPRGDASMTGWDNRGHALPLMQMTIKNAAAYGTAEFQAILESVDASVIESIEKNIAAGIVPYFFVASYTEQFHKDILDWEEKIGNDFLGKYFIRKYASTYSVSPSFVAADSDSVSFFPKGTSNFPFSPLFPYQNGESYMSEFIDYDPNGDSKIKDSFILVNRTNQKIPNQEDKTILPELADVALDYLPIRLSPIADYFPDGNYPFPNSVNGSSFKANYDESDFLYIGFVRTGGFNSKKMEVASHPKFKRFMYSYDPNSLPISLGSINDSAPYFYFGNIQFWLPPQSSVVNAIDGYDVYYKNDTSMGDIRYQPKVEMVLQNLPSQSVINKTMGLDVKYTDFIPRKNHLYKPSLRGGCEQNYAAVYNEMVESADGYDYYDNSIHETKTYTLDGLPRNNFSIKDGLSSMSIRYDGTKVQTTISFSDYKDLIAKQSDSVKEFQNNLDKVFDRHSIRNVSVGAMKHTINTI